MAKRVNILAFETSSFACSVALQNGDQIALRHQIAPMQQTQLILSMIQEVLHAQSLTLSDLDAVAYGCGPGSFTGIRIANTVAQGLGFAANLPLIQVSSLAALAQSAFIEYKWQNLLVAVDARMEQIYWASYQINQDGQAELIGKESVFAPNTVKIEKNLMDTEWFAVGDGWERYNAALLTGLNIEPVGTNASQLPNAQAVLELSKAKFDKKDWVEASLAAPAYLR